MNYIWLLIALFIGWMIGRYILDLGQVFGNFLMARRVKHGFWKSIKIAFIQVRL